MKSIKKQLTFFLFFCLALQLYSTPGNSQSSKSGSLTENNKALRILVIGNSFSRNATLYLPQLAEEGGHKLVIQKAEISGGSLQMHWDAVKIAESSADNPKGKPYNGKSLKMLLMMGEYDFITFQQVSILSAYYKSYYPFIEELYNYVKKYQPKSEVIIHQIWPYRKDAKTFSKITEDERARNSKEMWKKSRAAYHKVAREFNAKIIPTGDAFQAINSSRKWGFIPDESFNFENPEYPQLPNQNHSLNVGYYWDKNKKLQFDPNHASDAGCFLGSLIWYSVLFNESPHHLKFTPPSVSSEYANQLRKVAWKVAR